MTIRWAKIGLLGAVALFYTLVVLNNLTDFDSNYQFVRHVLMMDTTFPGNQGMWRAIGSPAVHLAFYFSIIGWEIVTMMLCWWGVVALLRARGGSAAVFEAAKRVPVMALTLGMLMWMVAFLSVGAEWFLMWQSHLWNGQEAAFRSFTVVAVVLVLMVLPERDGQA